MVSPVRRSKRRIWLRRDVDVVGAGQVVVLGRAQEAEAVGQAFEHAFGEDEAALFGLGLQDFEDQFLLAQAGGAGDVHVLGDLVELLNAHVLQLDQVERRGAGLGGLRGALLAALLRRGGLRSAGVGAAAAAGGRQRSAGGAAGGGAAAAGGLPAAAGAAGGRPRAAARPQAESAAAAAGGFGSAAGGFGGSSASAARLRGRLCSRRSRRRLSRRARGFSACRLLGRLARSCAGFSVSAGRRGAFAGGCLFGGFFGIVPAAGGAYRG